MDKMSYIHTYDINHKFLFGLGLLISIVVGFGE